MKHRRMIVVPLLFCLLASPASTLLTPIGAAATVNISASAATPHFPQNIAFHLEARAASGEITGLNLLYHATNTPVTKRVRVPVERAQQIKLDYALDTQTDFLAPGLDIEYRWAFTLSDGTQYRTDPTTLFYMDDQEQWKKKTKGSITLWWYSGDDTFGQDVIDTATRAADTLKKNFNVTGDQPIRILIYANTRDLRVALPPNSAEWIGGGASPELGIIHAAIAPGGSAASEIRRIIPHEMSHMVVYQASLNPYNHPPLWLDEGLAVHNQETPDIRFRPLVRDAADNGKLIPVRALDSPFPFNAEQALLSYAESESIVNFIINAYGSKYIGALVSAFKGELSYDQVVQKVLKESIEDLDKEWKASLNYSGDQGGITG
ncbi:MAG: peptidase MA family metallohydrolase [Chloroflexota bacterium]|nr:peptidase MA family metallohydrolase [Chloroflexota bacterium]